jgi:hypothetical protein
MATNNELTIREKLEILKKNLYEELNLLKSSLEARGLDEIEQSQERDSEVLCEDLYTYSEIPKALKHRKSHKRARLCTYRKYSTNKNTMC